MADISQIKTPDNTTYDLVAHKLKTARQIVLDGAIKGSVNFDGSGDVSIETSYPGENEVSNPLSWLQNSTAHTSTAANDGRGVLNWLWVTGSDGKKDYVLVPRKVDGTKYDAYLGEASTPFLGLYTGFVRATGLIATTGNMTCNNLTTDNNIVTKNVTASGNLYAKGSGTNGGVVQAKSQLYSEGILTVADTANIGGITTVASRIQPNSSQNTVNLGYNDVANHRWANIYSKTAVNVSSDRRVKTEIQEIDDRYIELFDLVQPCSYKFIDGTSGRVHTGFISQDVEDAMEKVGLEATELAFFCKDLLFKEEEDENGELVQVPDLDENGVQKYYYSLRYEEYIAIMTEKIKRLEEKLNKYSTLEARLSNLEEKVLLQRVFSKENKR